MGAEQSILGRTKEYLKTTAPSSPKTIATVQNYCTSVEGLPPDFRQFLQDKQVEFESLIDERNQLRLDLAASELASQSIDDAYVRYIDKLNMSRVDAIANAVASEAIAEALVSELSRSSKSKTMPMSKAKSKFRPDAYCPNNDANSY